MVCRAQCPLGAKYMGQIKENGSNLLLTEQGKFSGEKGIFSVIQWAYQYNGEVGEMSVRCLY